MMTSLDTYLRRSRSLLRQWAGLPRFHGILQGVGYLVSGFALSAAALESRLLPLPLGLVCACSGWSAILSAVGGALGYLVFWGSAGYQGLFWLALGLLCSLLLFSRRLADSSPLLLPATGALICAATGLVFQTWANDSTPILLYVVRCALAAGSIWLFSRVIKTRDPILEWLTCGLAVLALAQIAPLPYLSLGFLAAGILISRSAFPAAALAGLALDLAGLTPVPMAAVACLSWLVRLLPRIPKLSARLAPGLIYLLIMGLCNLWAPEPIPMLLAGGLLGGLLPGTQTGNYRRGETGTAQVRLEMASGVLAQTEQLLLEVSTPPVDEKALVLRATERACGSCPCRKSCRDIQRIGQMPTSVLYKPLLSPEELPLRCRKNGRLLAELHRSQEQLRSIRIDRQRQQEYRFALTQQYRFLSQYLQELSDQLTHRISADRKAYAPSVQFFGSRPEDQNGDRCCRFSGVGSSYYVLLCDGMGTGMGAVQESRTASALLRRLLEAGYPPEHALRSLNSLCALRDRAGAVTIDLLELQLDTGRAALYKWGAAPSYLVSRLGVEKLGTAGPPPGLSVSDCRETVDRLTLRRGELLLMVSDGVDPDFALRCCAGNSEASPEELAEKLLTAGQLLGQDDATVITVLLTAPTP